MRGVVLLSGASKCLMKVQVSLCQAGLPLAAESRSGAGLTLCPPSTSMVLRRYDNASKTPQSLAELPAVAAG